MLLTQYGWFDNHVEGSSHLDDHVSPTLSSASVDHQRLLAEQNKRLAEILIRLEDATKLGHSLLSQHPETILTIQTLEEQVVGLERAVEGQEADAEKRWRG